MELAVTSELRPGAVVVRVAGELHMASSPELAEHVDGMELGPAVVLVVDLGGVTFLDSSGLNSLVALRRAVMDLEGRLGLVAGERTVRLLQVTNMDDVFAMYDSVELAVDDLSRAV